MRDVTFEGFGHAPNPTDQDEELPAFVFEVEMHEGFDPTGSFEYQFAAANVAEGVRFVLATPDEKILAVLDIRDEAVQQLVDDLIDRGKFIAAINYENYEWQEGNQMAIPILGRDLGRTYDHVEVYDLDAQDVQALREIRTVLTDHFDL